MGGFIIEKCHFEKALLTFNVIKKCMMSMRAS